MATTTRRIAAAAAPLYRNRGGRACWTISKGAKQEKQASTAAPSSGNKAGGAWEWWAPDPATGVWLPEGHQLRLDSSACLQQQPPQVWFRDDVHSPSADERPPP